MTQVHIAMIEDRHTDVEVEVFADPQAAIEYARRKALEYARDPADLDESEAIEGWLYYARYSEEGDCVRVEAKELRS